MHISSGEYNQTCKHQSSCRPHSQGIGGGVVEELKPCPFCGGKVVGFEWSDYYSWEEGEPHDEDAFCDVKVDHKKDCILKLGEFNLWAANTEEEAAKLWNTRANERDNDYCEVEQ